MNAVVFSEHGGPDVLRYKRVCDSRRSRRGMNAIDETRSSKAWPAAQAFELQIGEAIPLSAGELSSQSALAEALHS